MRKTIFETLAASVVGLATIFVFLAVLGWCEDHPLLTVAGVLVSLGLAFRHELKIMGGVKK